MTGRFSKRDWQDLAAYLRGKIAGSTKFEVTSVYMGIVDDAAVVFGRDSAHFDRSKFLNACGISASLNETRYVIRRWITPYGGGKDRPAYWSNTVRMWTFEISEATVFSHQEVMAYPALPTGGEWVVA